VIVVVVATAAVGLDSVEFEVRRWAFHWWVEDLFALPHCG